ncbi:MAG: SDR family oxidoreductase [Actinomycetota bacterium]|nr:SDR family oxidoreductase [Actinomycetota bacterium]
MNVLVTGSHGYIGSVTVPLLRAAGHDVTGLDSLLYRGCDLFADEDDARTLELDVRDVGREHLEGFDAVVHLAALSNDPLGDLDRELTLEINYRATVRLARAAKDAGVERFVFSSSCSMYGASGEDDLVDEQAPLRPLTAYAESKVRAEEELAELADDGFAPVFMRNATAYGVSPRLRIDLVLNNLVGWAHTTGAVRILSDGTPWRPLVHVEDIAGAALAALEAPVDTVRGEAFNVGAAAENHQVRDLAEIVRETVGDCTVEYAGSGDPDPRSYRVDFAKLHRTFPDFSTRWTARTGAEELLAAYRGTRLDRETFEGPRYTRLKRLRELLESGEVDGELRRRARTLPAR